ncbi:MAG: hypothetical protein LUC89_09260 [Oscillospiraceae bacterium]|nr:hypothetical protein [Oscillospiraceae bacterium]
MKRPLLVFLALCLMLSVLAGCGGTSDAVTEAVSAMSEAYDEVAETEVETEPETEAEAEPEADAETETEPEAEAAPEEETEAASETSFEEITVIDNDQCSLVITALDPDNLWGYTLKVALENKSEDTTYMFSVLTASVDGVESDPYWASEVAAGKKANEEITFYDDILDEIGVGYTDIALTFHVYDSDDWMADDVAEETVHIYPYGEENAKAYVREAQESDVVLVDNDQITAIVIGCEDDPIWGYTVSLYLENKTDEELMFSAEDVSVNGYMSDPYWATTVDAGNCKFTEMTWYTEDLEADGIDQVEEIELTLWVYSYDDWTADDILNETFTLTP